MNYLYAAYSEDEGGQGVWAEAGEPLVPNFPTGAQNTFLGLRTFKPTPYGRVGKEADVDALADALAVRFTGLPRAMLNAYVVETALLASQLPVGTVCQPYIDPDGERVTVRIAEVPQNDHGVAVDDIYELWERQPIPGGLR